MFPKLYECTYYAVNVLKTGDAVIAPYGGGFTAAPNRAEARIVARGMIRKPTLKIAVRQRHIVDEWPKEMLEFVDYMPVTTS